MEMYLKSYGIDYQLGLDSIEVDETLEKMDLIHQGDFLRVCRLFEKSFYGEIELEEFDRYFFGDIRRVVGCDLLLYTENKKIKIDLLNTSLKVDPHKLYRQCKRYQKMTLSQEIGHQNR